MVDDYIKKRYLAPLWYRIYIVSQLMYRYLHIMKIMKSAQLDIFMIIILITRT